MADSDHKTASFHPIAPRVKGGHHGKPKPHVGPSRKDYEDHHKQTVGPGSDAWWAKVRKYLEFERTLQINVGGVDGKGDVALG